MKKMAYAIIFIVILSLLVFAGCTTFSIDMGTTDEAIEPGSQSTEQAYIYIPETDEQGENVTDEQGETKLVPVTVDENTEPGTVYVPETDEAGENVTDEEGSTKMVVVTESTHQVYVPETNKKGEKVTDKQGSTVLVPSSETTTKPGSTPPKKTTSEYEALRSGTFYMKGTMKDSTGTNPMEVALTPDSVFMMTKFEGNDMGILVSSGKTYLIYPAEKGYLKLSSVLMGMMGLDTDDLFDVDSLGFSDMLPLDEADSTKETTFNGKKCTAYTFGKQDGTKAIVYGTEKKLYGLETVEASGTVTSSTIIDSITANVPDDRINPPDYYRELGLTDFMKILGETQPQ